MPCYVISELIGTFVFFTVILKFGDKELGPFAIGLTLIAMILFSKSLSGGNFNPGVTLMMTFKDFIDNGKLPDSSKLVESGIYIGAQLSGAVLALYTLKLCKEK
mgnify:CR=1 FL=1